MLIIALLAAMPALTDQQLIALATRRYDKRAVMNRREVIGRYHGIEVIAEYPCSDICPDYTARIIRLAVEPGRACAAANGVTAARRVPVGIAAVNRAYCVPKPIAAIRPR
jgi:hypothetical protein